jgi:hypothetical protein
VLVCAKGETLVKYEASPEQTSKSLLFQQEPTFGRGVKKNENSGVSFQKQTTLLEARLVNADKYTTERNSVVSTFASALRIRTFARLGQLLRVCCVRC